MWVESEMPSAEQLSAGGNRLLAVATPADLERIAARAQRVGFGRGDTIAPANKRAPAAFFIERGVASVIKPADGERRTELCLIGPESFIGSAIVLADGSWPYATLVQVDELIAIRVEADDLRALLRASEDFRTIMLGAVHMLTVQIAEGLASAAWQQIGARLARWLLMYRDRLGSDRLDLTHEFMALMVGAQRPRITAALHELEGDGAIRAGRGHVVIRDADRLRAAADGSYGLLEREQARLFPPAGRA